MARKIERFSTPALFEEIDHLEEKFPLDIETVKKSSKETWLIRAPSQFDGALLDGITLNLHGESVQFSVADKNKTYEAMAVQELQENVMASPYLLLPTGDQKALAPAPAFTGQITIMDVMSVPVSSSLPDVVASITPTMPEGLRQRYKPYGWEEPRHLKDHLSREDLEEMSSPGQKKKKKKKRKSASKESHRIGVYLGAEGVESQDFDAIDGKKERTSPDSSLNADSERKERKAKRKRRSEEVVTEEAVPTSEVPSREEEETAESSRKKKKKKKRSSSSSKE